MYYKDPSELLGMSIFPDGCMPSGSFNIITTDNTVKVMPAIQPIGTAMATATSIDPSMIGEGTIKVLLPMNPEEHRPCPMCGSTKLWRTMEGNEGPFIECRKCGVRALEIVWDQRDRKTAADAVLGIKNR